MNTIIVELDLGIISFRRGDDIIQFKNTVTSSVKLVFIGFTSIINRKNHHAYQ